MSDLRSIVDRELDRVELRPFTLEAFHRRRERKRRNQRIAAGAVGLAIAIALIAVVIATSVVRSSPAPASTPSPHHPSLARRWAHVRYRFSRSHDGYHSPRPRHGRSTRARLRRGGCVRLVSRWREACLHAGAQISRVADLCATDARRGVGAEQGADLVQRLRLWRHDRLGTRWNADRLRERRRNPSDRPGWNRRNGSRRGVLPDVVTRWRTDRVHRGNRGT